MSDCKTVWAFLNISDLMVAWEVYRGVIIAPGCYSINGFPAVSSWQLKWLKHMDRIESINEIKLECIRQKFYPKAISRLSGFFCFESESIAKETAKFWGNMSHFTPFCLSELSISNRVEFSKHDSNWITEYIDKSNTSDEWMHLYWQGKICPLEKSPRWELLVVARASVLNNELRNQAYENLKQKSKITVLPFLELSRLSAYIGFDLGHITPYIQHVSTNRFKVVDCVDMRDANNPVFLDELGKYINDPLNKQSINEEDLKKLNYLEVMTVPDTTERNFEFEISTNCIKDQFIDIPKILHIR